MTRKKKAMIWAAVIAILVGGFLALRIPSWTRTYGLSEEVIAGERTPTAEETIRLYFYYCNRQDSSSVYQLLTEEYREYKEWIADDEPVFWLFKPFAVIEDVLREELPNWLTDTKLLEITQRSAYTRDNHETEEWGGVYRVIEYEVDYNEGSIWVPAKQVKGSDYDTFTMIQKEEGGAWEIDGVGKP